MNMLNPYMVAIALGLLLVSFIAGGFLGWHERSIRVPDQLQGQQVADQVECAKGQQLTEDTNDQLKKSRDDIAAKLAALQLQQPAACVPLPARTGVPNSGDQHARPNGGGLSTSWLRQFAAEAEGYRSQLTICTDFLLIERQSHPNN